MSTAKEEVRRLLDELAAAAECLERDSPRYATIVIQGGAASRSLVHMSERGRYLPQM